MQTFYICIYCNNMKEILKQVIFDQQTFNTEGVIKREIPNKFIEDKEILVISGIRRCGKSTLLQQIRNTFSQNNFYLNFDDERLVNFKLSDFQILYELFIELFGEQKTFFFDEIQNIVGWERFVRRLFDSGFKIFVTGSNASMLSKELGTHLTGRYCQYELYPFSLIEYLQLKNIKLLPNMFYTTTGKALITREFNNYAVEGGFPQYLISKNSEFLKSLYESILYRDVMVRNKITNEREMLELVYFLASNVSVLSSNNSLTKVIGVNNATTVKNYINYLNNSYILFQVNKFDYSLKKQIQNPKKTYFIDNALIKSLGFSVSDNTGRLLENLVFVELKRRNKNVFYHSSKFECDFIIRTNTVITQAIQVCHVLETNNTKQREINGLLDALNAYNLNEGLILTSYFEEELIVNTKTIKIIPVWKWLLHAVEI